MFILIISFKVNRKKITLLMKQVKAESILVRFVHDLHK